ncbi:hypothetical protein EUTSA_v10017173mg [Eutrema salsugineum]|uniref:VQ domain-containing protein n=1 Tax=Eutrema salsugineum TaxID=72664 RepID=V4M8Z4_EUTSA|nr:calmodulin-binding protein 25 [Eutrema salsugineum]ESQ52819.1 hypothetical protein EUTSA_v10017173mg [Eutrema salsugineum]
MVSSEGLASVEPWLYRQGFNVDSWLLPDTFSHDSNLLAKALHSTVSPLPPPHTLSPSSAFFDSQSHPSSTHTLSSSAGSDPDIIGGGGGGGGGAKRKRSPVSEGKATTKRRSRASKKSQTTFITADPSNFRQMVQQVTGAKFIGDSSSVIFAPLVKPEPHRLVNRLPCVSSEKSTAVPTLDTSAFLSNHHQDNLSVGNNFSGSAAVGLPPSKTRATADTGGSAAEIDTYPNFPTLESWKVM